MVVMVGMVGMLRVARLPNVHIRSKSVTLFYVTLHLMDGSNLMMQESESDFLMENYIT